jgi:hypothetical protein
MLDPDYTNARLARKAGGWYWEKTVGCEGSHIIRRVRFHGNEGGMRVESQGAGMDLLVSFPTVECKTGRSGVLVPRNCSR